jgi:UTP--glucose-1-phosphate uridylyltransferase
MKIKRAIFPVGGLGTRFLPATKAMPKEMLPVVDKPLIQYAVEEAVEAGCEELIFVTGRGKTAIEDHFDHSFELESALEQHSREGALEAVRAMLRPPGAVAYVRQQSPAGLGHAVWCARHLVGDEPVAVLLADDLISASPGCLRQMVERYEGGNMVAVMEVGEREVSSYGIVAPGEEREGLVEVRGLVEKPQVAQAPSRLAVVGRYIIEPGVFRELGRQERGANGEVQLTDSLARRVGAAPFWGLRFEGSRYDCGSKVGFLQANVAHALSDPSLSAELLPWLRARLGLGEG